MRIRLSLSIFGNSVWRVMKLSINPAIMNMGIVPTTIFTPLLAPLLNDSSLEYVPGKSHPLPKASPAAQQNIRYLLWRKTPKEKAKSLKYSDISLFCILI